MRLFAINRILAIGAIACSPSASADTESGASLFEQARSIELELRSLGADRIADYLLPTRDLDKLAIELIFDRHELYNPRTPATAFRFERDDTGLWKGRGVEGQIPLGAVEFWPVEVEPDSTGYVCNDQPVEISSDAAQALHALVAVEWNDAPSFTERDSSHPTMVGIRILNDDQRSERYFAYLRSPEHPVFELSPEQAEAFEREYNQFERHVVELAEEFDFGRTDCDPSNASFELPRNPALDELHEQEFAPIRDRLNAAYAQIREVRESKE